MRDGDADSELEWDADADADADSDADVDADDAMADALGVVAAGSGSIAAGALDTGPLDAGALVAGLSAGSATEAPTTSSRRPSIVKVDADDTGSAAGADAVGTSLAAATDVSTVVSGLGAIAVTLDALIDGSAEPPLEALVVGSGDPLREALIVGSGDPLREALIDGSGDASRDVLGEGSAESEIVADADASGDALSDAVIDGLGVGEGDTSTHNGGKIDGARVGCVSSIGLASAGTAPAISDAASAPEMAQTKRPERQRRSPLLVGIPRLPATLKPAENAPAYRPLDRRLQHDK